jgi:hypothetical protein
MRTISFVKSKSSSCCHIVHWIPFLFPSVKEAKISTFTVLSVVAKVLNRILLTRLLKAVDEKQREQQAGFRKDRSCTDQIAALQIITKNCNKRLLMSVLDSTSTQHVNFFVFFTSSMWSISTKCVL